MATPKKCKHDWFPVALDYDEEFLVIACSECNTREWRNVHRLNPNDGEE